MDGGHGEEMMEAMRRQQELVMQLRALVLPLLHDDNTSADDLAVQLFDDVIACNIAVASKLRLVMTSSGGGGAGNVVDNDLVVDDDYKSLVVGPGKSNDDDTTSKQHQAANKPKNESVRVAGQKRSRCVI
jgi:hypothetical protein